MPHLCNIHLRNGKCTHGPQFLRQIKAVRQYGPPGRQRLEVEMSAFTRITLIQDLPPVPVDIILTIDPAVAHTRPMNPYMGRG